MNGDFNRIGDILRQLANSQSYSLDEIQLFGLQTAADTLTELDKFRGELLEMATKDEDVSDHLAADLLRLLDLHRRN